MLTQSFAALLRALDVERDGSHLLLDPEDRAAARRLADGIEHRWGGTKPAPDVVLVHGPGVDPVVAVIEDMEQTLRHLSDEIDSFDDHLAFVRGELTRRHHAANQEDS